MNLTISERIKHLSYDDLHWPFQDKNPQFHIKSLTKPSTVSVKVDPFRAYKHDAAIVMSTALQVETLFPMGFLPTYYIMDFEEETRSNGHAYKLVDWNGTRPAPYDPYIVFSAKRTPPHPAMTRYLVAHEYGHHVQNWIEYKRGIKQTGTSTKFEREYAELRGVELNTEYGGGRWHTNIGELIANDFRLCITGIEQEFWPHPGFAMPHELPDVELFWKNALLQYGNTDITAGQEEF